MVIHGNFTGKICCSCVIDAIHIILFLEVEFIIAIKYPIKSPALIKYSTHSTGDGQCQANILDQITVFVQTPLVSSVQILVPLAYTQVDT